MHYKNGIKALVGDIVCGKGFNIPYDIVGPVILLKPQNGTCNLEVSTVVSKLLSNYDEFVGDVPPKWSFETVTEYGDVSQFELIYRKNWCPTPSKSLVWKKE